MLDFIVAKMLAKPVEERYQDAHEATRDLRECERQLAASAITPQPHSTLPGVRTGPADRQRACAHRRARAEREPRPRGRQGARRKPRPPKLRAAHRTRPSILWKQRSASPP